MIIRDIDVFKKIMEKNNAIVKLSITCVDDALSSIIEPHVCPSSARFEALSTLSEAGIFCGVLFTPVLPFISDDIAHMQAMVKKSAQHGAKFIFSMYGVTLRENQREYYYAQLERHFPGLSMRYKQAFKGQYICHINQRERWMYEFEKACKQWGLLYKMKDIIKAYKVEDTPTQMSLF